MALPRTEAIEQLERELEHHKDSIIRAFLVEVRSTIERVQDGVQDVKERVSIVQVDVRAVQRNVDDMQHRQTDGEDEKRLESLRPPTNSTFSSKPMCHKGTRTEILDKIDIWAGRTVPRDGAESGPREGTVPARLLWLYGVAGCGKSTISASVCHRFGGDRHVGSFFCKRDEGERRNGVRLFWSIAFHLARINNTYKDQLLRCLREHTTFLDLNLDMQVRRVLIQPLTSISDPFQPSAFFVIDALDECIDGGKVAQNLARVLRTAPWIYFLVTSRNLPEIRNELTLLGDLMEEHDLFKMDARKDIREYLKSQLSQGQLAELSPHIGREEVSALVDRSQGLFIWIHTVVEFILSSRKRLKALKDILNLENMQESESALDSIYRVVLENAAGSSNSDDVAFIRHTVGLILITSANSILPADALYAFSPPDGLTLRSDFDNILQYLSPVLIIDDNGVRVYHTSFIDFLSRKSRCGDSFYTSQDKLNAIMATGCLEIMESGALMHKHLPKKTDRGETSGLKFNICNLESSLLANKDVTDLKDRRRRHISAELLYSSTFWFEHLHKSSILGGEPGESANATKMVKNLLCTERALFWLEIMSLSNRLPVALSVLVHMESNARVSSLKRPFNK